MVTTATSSMYSQSYKRYVTTLLLGIYIFNRADAAIFGFLMEPIKHEFGLSDTELGFLAGPALVLFYAVLGIPVARLADRSNRVNIMSVAVALWSVIVTLSSAVTTFWHFALARVGVGIGEAGFSAVAQSLLTDYHRPSERTRALSILMLGIPLGKVVSSLAAGWINELYGWRAVFLVAGIPGILLATLLKSTVQEPDRSASGAVASVADRPSILAVFKSLWSQHTLRHLAIATALSNVVCFSMLAWTPAFFVRNHGMATGELGTWLAVVSGIGGSAGIWFGGRIKGTQNWSVSLRMMTAVTAFAAPTVVVALWISPKEAALLTLLVGYALSFFFFGPSFSLVQEMAAASTRATMASVFVLIQALTGGVVGVQMIGILSDVLTRELHDSALALRWSLTVTALLAIWAAFHFWRIARCIEKDRASSRSAESGASHAGAGDKAASYANRSS